jgi:hypothetical protein
MIHSRAAMNEDDVDASLESFARGGDTNAIGTVASNVIQRVCSSFSE